MIGVPFNTYSCNYCCAFIITAVSVHYCRIRAAYTEVNRILPTWIQKKKEGKQTGKQR